MRTLCIGDPKEPTYTRELLVSEGWTERASAPNKEIIFVKGDLMGFWNEQSGRFVTCKYDDRYFDYVEDFVCKAYNDLWWESIRDRE